MNEDLLTQFKEVEDLYFSYLEETKNLTEQQFNYQPAPDKWSIAQVLHHIWLANNFTYIFVKKKIEKREAPKKSGLVNYFISIGLKVALYSPLKFKAPKYVKENTIKHATHQEISEMANKTFDEIRLLLKDFPKELKHVVIFKHPIVGWINISQSIDFLKAHTIHHKMQIERLKKEIRHS